MAQASQPGAAAGLAAQAKGGGRCKELTHDWARVSAHFVAVKGQAKPKTTILMKFEPAVLQRESRLPSA